MGFCSGTGGATGIEAVFVRSNVKNIFRERNFWDRTRFLFNPGRDDD